MSPIDAAIIRGKLGHIMTSLDLLRPMRAMALAEYRERVWERKGIERVDDAKVLAAVGTILDLYPRYIQAIENELTTLGL